MIPGSSGDFLQALAILGAMTTLGVVLWRSVDKADERSGESVAQRPARRSTRTATTPGGRVLVQSSGPQAQTRPAPRGIDAPQDTAAVPRRPSFEGERHRDPGLRRRT
ncbi:MAG: hypothetical protein QOH48_892 [Actinomycetota bacterium]|jgi:hypothetical protein|nr:hypothetical protein [Actinomycetota bacterium]